MKSITSSSTGRLAAYWGMGFYPLSPVWRRTDPGEASGNEATDWREAVGRTQPTFMWPGEQANSIPDIEWDWASLAKAARNRWLRENPF